MDGVKNQLINVIQFIPNKQINNFIETYIYTSVAFMKLFPQQIIFYQTNSDHFWKGLIRANMIYTYKMNPENGYNPKILDITITH